MRYLLIIALLVLFSSRASAIEVNPTSLTFSKISSGGKNNGCSLGFILDGQDVAYKSGKSITVWGDFSVISEKGKMAYGFKVGVADLSKALEYIKNNKGYLLQSDKINYAYFQSDKCLSMVSKEDKELMLNAFGKKEEACLSSANQELKTFTGEKGEFLAAYNWDSLFFDNVDGFNNIEIGFNREKGGIDNKLALDLKNKENFSEISKFFKCSSEIKKRILDHIKSTRTAP
jgi:hypothetical protein